MQHFRIQGDLLEWMPAPDAVSRFDDDRVRGATVADKICRGISETLRDAKGSRCEIAAGMSGFLGEAVSENMVNAYASQSRTDHVINIVRFVALLHVTRDRRLLEMVAEMFGWIVVEKRFLNLIELARLQEKQRDIKRRAEAARRLARRERVL